MNDKEHEKHFKNALSNYGGVLNVLDQLNGEGIPHNPSKQLPNHWEQDHYLLYGEYLKPMDLTEDEITEYRESNASLIDKYGAQWFWENRRRLAAEIIFLRHF